MTEKFASTLQALVDRSGISNKGIGEAVGSHSGSAYITHLLDGTFSPSPGRAAQLARVLDVASEDLANFLLEAAGYDEELIIEALRGINDTGVLLEGETIVLRRGRVGWLVKSNP